MFKWKNPANLRYVERSRLKQKVDQVNEVLGFIVIPAINKLLAAAGSVVTSKDRSFWQLLDPLLHLRAREKRGQKAAERCRREE